MRIIQKPWGCEKIWAETNKNYLGKIIVIEPGHRLSRQYHQFKSETFMVLKGVLTLEIGSGANIKTHILQVEDCFDCPAGIIHRLICDDKEPEAVQVVEVSTYHPYDIVRLEDDYGR